MALGYYPFGLKQKGYNNTISSNGNDLAQAWKFNWTELNESLNLDLYEMDLRLFDPAIARWNGIDIVTHFDYSTYSAFDNNPIVWADPSGADSYLWALGNNGRKKNNGRSGSLSNSDIYPNGDEVARTKATQEKADDKGRLMPLQVS